MTALSIQPPFPIFTETDGSPLENGYIWLGTANLNPQTNPIAVYWDAALTQPAALPVRTRGGYPVNAGTPARLYVGSDYSILVQNKNGSQIYVSLNDNAFFGGGGSAASNATGNGSQTIFPVSSVPKAIYINGVYQNQNTYSVAGGSVTFTQAPPLTSVIEFLI
jgi:hypothetical protein